MTSQLLALQIYIATSGYHAYLMLLIENCLFQVINKGEYIVTIDNFIMAWNQGITSYVTKIRGNPFKLDMASISTKIKEFR